ncbi:MAG: hypothetical protein IJD35_04580 [Clostridia bacterium]|nr:hypothetical protein [Clostridia bacterium]
MACPLAFGETGVKSRIRAVLHYKKPAFWVIVVAILVLIVTCVCFLTNPVTDQDETTTAPSTTETPVTTTPQCENTPLTNTPTTTTAPTTTIPTTPEKPDAWKEKVVWESLKYGYDADTDMYQIRIIVQDIHGVGQKNADAAFAKKYGLYYSGKYYLSYYMFDIDATMEEIEMYARLEEVKSIEYPLPPYVPTPGITVDTYLDNAWWQEIQTMHGITDTENADGNKSYTFALTINIGSNLFPVLPIDHPTHPGVPTLQFTTAEGAFVFIKDINKDDDYTRYQVTNWQVMGQSELRFEAAGFVAEEDGEYDMYLFFVMPEGTPYPGERCYIWALEKPWTLNS